MRKIYYFNEQGSQGFTNIADKKLLSEVIYCSYRLYLIREAYDNVDDFLGENRLMESTDTSKFGIGPFLYDDDEFYFKKIPAETPPNKWARHVNIIDEHKDELGVPVTDNNRLEINRAFNRGFTMWDPDNETFVIMAGTFFKPKDTDQVLEAFKVPKDVKFLVKKIDALNAAEIDPKYFKG